MLCTLCLWQWLDQWYGTGNERQRNVPSFIPPCQRRSALWGSEASECKKSDVVSRLSIRPCFVQLRIKLILHSSVCPTRLSVYSVSHTHFPGNCKNHFFPMFKSSPIVCTIYGHVSYAAILYTKPEGPYFHHVKYHRYWSSHSRVEICA